MPFFFLLFISSGYAQSTFYDIDSIQTIRLTFTQTNWDYQLDTAKNGNEGYVMALHCIVNGTMYDSVGVKFKGNSSYNANSAKNPLHISLDAYKSSQDYHGLTDFKLSNGAKDPSFVREALSYAILKNYMDCPRANYARVFVNENYYGLMVNVEDVGTSFCGNHFFTTNGVRVKCNPTNVMNGGGSGLVFNTLDSTKYFTNYEIKSDYGWKELIDLIDTLNNKTASLAKILDIDRALWMLAFNTLLVNLDSYSGAIRQNYYLYRDGNGRFCPVVWDLNESFGAFTALGSTMGGFGQNLDSIGMRNLTVTPHLSDSGWPLINKLLANSTYMKQYIAHMKTISDEMFSTGNYFVTGQAMQSIIDSSVTADQNKFYTTVQFHDNLIKSITGAGGGPFGGKITGIKNLMTGRVDYLNSTTAFQQISPDINTPVISPAVPQYQDSINIISEITNTSSVYLAYRYGTPDIFQHLFMYDDGHHHDGIAGDGLYGATIAAKSARIEFYIYAENNNAGIFSPVRAEHEFYIIEVSVNQLLPGAVTINEFLADNVNGATDPNGQHEDWIEMYNSTNETQSLAGLYLSDDESNKTKWAFPQDASITAHDYAIVWADEDGMQDGWHANFKLSKSGEMILFGYGDSNVLEQYTFGQQQSDISKGRCANGIGDFVSQSPSFGAVNNCNVASNEIRENRTISLYPNP
ncbi:MAG: CotH kinase family protein, partial [Saprospiraceae bacterium]